MKGCHSVFKIRIAIGRKILNFIKAIYHHNLLNSYFESLLVFSQKFRNSNRWGSKNFVFIIYLLLWQAISPPRTAAQDDPSVLIGKITPPPGVINYGPLGLIPFLNNILRLVFIIAGLYAFLNLIFAGFQFISAGGDPKKIQSAWAKIWQSFVGLLILVFSFIIAAIIGIVMFGDPTAILNPKITGAPTSP